MGTNTGTIMTLANSIIGVSVLAMPFCFKQCGIVLSIVMLVASSLLSRLACYLLLKSAIMARRRTFEFLAFHTFGSTGKFAVELFVIGFLMGTCIAFFVVMGDLGPAIVAKVIGVTNTAALRPSVLIGLAIFVVLPLGMLRNVDSLSSVSMATIGFYICLVIKVFGEAVPHLLAGDWYKQVHFWRPAGILQCIPIFSMALFCQTQLFEIYDSMHNASLDRMNFVIRAACNICTGVYICVGFFGYIAFCTQSFTGNVLMSFTPSAVSEMIKLGFVLSVAMSFPLVIFPCRASLYSLLFRRLPNCYLSASLTQHSYLIHQTKNPETAPMLGGNVKQDTVTGPAYWHKVGVPHHEAVSSHSHIPEARFKCLTVFIVSAALLAGLLVPSIELVLGLVGSTIGVLICVMFPAAAFICMSARHSSDRLLAQVLLFVGALILVLGTYATLNAANDTKPGVENVTGHPLPGKAEQLPFVGPDAAVDSVSDPSPVKLKEPQANAEPMEWQEKAKPQDKLPAAASRQEPPVPLPAAASRQEPPVPLPAAASRQEPPVPLPAAASRREPPVPLPAAASHREPPVPLPAADSRREPPVPLPAAASHQEPPVPLPAAASRREPPVPLPADTSRREPPVPLPAANSRREQPAPAADVQKELVGADGQPEPPAPDTDKHEGPPLAVAEERRQPAADTRQESAPSPAAPPDPDPAPARPQEHPVKQESITDTEKKETARNGEQVHQDAIKKEDEELAEAARREKVIVDSKNEELLRKLEKHDAQQKQILKEQQLIMQALQQHSELERLREQQQQQQRAAGPDLLQRIAGGPAAGTPAPPQIAPGAGAGAGVGTMVRGGAEAGTGARVGVEIDNRAGVGVETGARARAAAGAETKVRTGVGIETGERSGVEIGLKPGIEPEAKAEVGVAPRARSEAGSETKAEAKVVARAASGVVAEAGDKPKARAGAGLLDRLHSPPIPLAALQQGLAAPREILQEQPQPRNASPHSGPDLDREKREAENVGPSPETPLLPENRAKDENIIHNIEQNCPITEKSPGSEERELPVKAHSEVPPAAVNSSAGADSLIINAERLSDLQVPSDSPEAVSALNQAGHLAAPNAKPMKRDLKSLPVPNEKTDSEHRPPGS